MSEPVPKITLINKGLAQFEAYANAYVVSENEYRMADGTMRRELYYLSMFGPRGSGVAINAIFSGLVSQPAVRDIYIEGIGAVALMHRSDRIRTTGYAPSWSCDFTEFGPDRAIHALVESKVMTLWDPQQAQLSRRRSSSGQKGKHRDGQKSTSRGKREGGSLSSQAGEMSEEAAQKHERHPIFLLLVPGGVNRNDLRDEAAERDQQADEKALKWLQQLHIAYLDKRCPWPLVDEWAEFLWNRANSSKSKEIERLHVWSYQPPSIAPSLQEPQEQVRQAPDGSEVLEDDDEEQGDSPSSSPDATQADRVLPVLSDAYLCYPDMVKMIRDLSEHIGSVQGLSPLPSQAQATGTGLPHPPDGHRVAA